MSGPRWALRLLGSDPPLYWSSLLGWAEAGEAPDIFTPEERERLEKAMPFHLNEGSERWVCADCGQGDPTSPDHICR